MHFPPPQPLPLFDTNNRLSADIFDPLWRAMEIQNAVSSSRDGRITMENGAICVGHMGDEVALARNQVQNCALPALEGLGRGLVTYGRVRRRENFRRQPTTVYNGPVYVNTEPTRQQGNSQKPDKKSGQMGQGERALALGLGAAIAGYVAYHLGDDIYSYRFFSQEEERLNRAVDLINERLPMSLTGQQVSRGVEAFVDSTLGILQSEKRDKFWSGILKASAVFSGILLVFGGLSGCRTVCLTGLGGAITSFVAMRFKEGILRSGATNLEFARNHTARWNNLMESLGTLRPIGPVRGHWDLYPPPQSR